MRCMHARHRFNKRLVPLRLTRDIPDTISLIVPRLVVGRTELNEEGTLTIAR